MTLNALARLWPRSLSSRIVALFLGMLLVVQLASFAVVRWSIDHNARVLLSEDLAVGERIWLRLLSQRAQQLTLGASVLAADYGFRAAAASGDGKSVSSALARHGARIGATVTALLGSDLSLRALGEATDRGAIEALRPLAARLAEQGSALAMLGEQPYQVVMVPIKAPSLVGYVVMGFALDAALVDDMHAVSGLHAAVLVRTRREGAERVALSTLPAAASSGLLGPLVAADVALLDDVKHVFRSVSLLSATGDPAGGTLRTVLMRSVDEAVAPYRQLQATLAALTLGGLLMAGAGSIVTARRVTTPLRSLLQATERLGRGEYGEPMQHTARRDEIGELARSFDQMRTSIATHQTAIRELAYWDRLTGLPNRAHFRDALRAAIDAESKGQHRQVAVVVLNLDRFKHVNDVLGYGFGDRLLRGVAARLTGQIVREGDLVARLSGDQFALLLPGSDARAALAVAERVAEVFQVPMTLDDHTVDVAAGFGVACWPVHATDADTLISRAEVAMYTAKRKSGSAQVYDPAIDAGSARSLSLLTELRAALDNEELRLFLQPKIALDSGRFVGAEALVRWQHPTRGMVPPMEFIPFAEQTGFVRQLTLWMVEATARQWAMLQALGLQAVSVNLSTRDLLDQELPVKIERILQRHGMPARAMCLEITESAIMEEPQRAEATLNTLSQAGFKLSIDDFGTGYSSLAYLKRLPVDELKIDRSFVMAMQTDESDAKIVRSTIDLAHNLGLTVVAEGVENAAILQRLADLECDQAQGYFMCRPLPAAEMGAFAARWAERARLAEEITLT
jgi:diguanylate cyclase (GGDEF)-like protein